MALEIERKFLISSFPRESLGCHLPLLIHQCYLAVGDEEVRVRMVDHVDHFMTIKRGGGLIRSEHEFMIGQSTYRQLIEGRKVLEKTRTIVNVQGGVIEVDEYLNLPYPYRLMTAEVEFETLEAANSFVPPDWFGMDVTKDRAFKNQAIWGLIE